jgi:hypothetical protein
MGMWAAALLVVTLQAASGTSGSLNEMAVNAGQTAAVATRQDKFDAGLQAASNETILIAGDIRLESLAALAVGGERFERRRFEITIRSRQGLTVHAEACIFADMLADADWEGTCFLLPVRAFDRQQAELLKAADVVPSDPVAQKLLRTLMVEANPLLRPARRVIGFYPGLALRVAIDRYPEADL